jgi:hypothetical protein
MQKMPRTKPKAMHDTVVNYEEMEAKIKNKQSDEELQ